MVGVLVVPWVKDGSGAVGFMASCEPRVVMVMSNHCTWVGRKFCLSNETFVMLVKCWCWHAWHKVGDTVMLSSTYRHVIMLGSVCCCVRVFFHIVSCDPSSADVWHFDIKPPMGRPCSCLKREVAEQRNLVGESHVMHGEQRRPVNNRGWDFSWCEVARGPSYHFWAMQHHHALEAP